MREIKFRAWFKPKNTMLYDIAPNEWVIGFDGIVYDHNTEWGSCSMDEDEGMILMQFTGLRDKNGNEIYEGDILALSHMLNWVVVWRQVGFYIYNEPNPENIFPLTDASNRAVIGNIYESPEVKL